MKKISKRKWRFYFRELCVATGLALCVCSGQAVLAGSTENAPAESDAQYTVPDEKIEEARALDTSGVADASDMTTVDEVEESGQSVTADMLSDGIYEIGVESSSSMFRIGSVTLTVSDHSMYVDLTMEGDGYLYLYPGTAEEAARADAAQFVYYEENEDGKPVFLHFPAEQLDQGVQCAAFSRKKQQWYPRTLVFQSAKLPSSAFLTQQGQSLTDLGLEDGMYEAEVSLQGEGRLKLISPMQIEITDGEAEGLLVFDSSKYDYIIIDNVRYDMAEGEENSAFRIPVTVFDAPVSMIADNAAIKGRQVEQEYQLTISAPTPAA